MIILDLIAIFVPLFLILGVISGMIDKVLDQDTNNTHHDSQPWSFNRISNRKK